jgi:threonine synthase
MNVSHLRCVLCGSEFPALPEASTCTHCSGDVNRPGILDLVYSEDPFGSVSIGDSESIEDIRFPDRNAGIWAFERFLPVQAGMNRITLGECHTPLIAAPVLAAELGLETLWLKNECQNPTGSLKDRIAPIVVAKALEANARVLIVISAGSMANAVASYGAACGLKTVAVMSPATRRERMIQTAISGGVVLRAGGSSADRIDLCIQAARRFGWYNATSPYNPYGCHGAKTIAYELYAAGKQFDWIIFPVGFGCNIVGVWKGFKELKQLGFISQLPKFAAVQPEGSPSLVRAFESGLKEAVPGPQETIAGGISQVVTPNSVLALNALFSTSGTAVAVSDAELIDSVRMLARKTGIFADPSGAAGLAGLRRLKTAGTIGETDRVLLMITGSGFKEPAIYEHAGVPDFPEIAPCIDMMEKVMPAEILGSF